MFLRKQDYSSHIEEGISLKVEVTLELNVGQLGSANCRVSTPLTCCIGMPATCVDRACDAPHPYRTSSSNSLNQKAFKLTRPRDCSLD